MGGPRGRLFGHGKDIFGGEGIPQSYSLAETMSKLKGYLPSHLQSVFGEYTRFKPLSNAHSITVTHTGERKESSA